MKNRTVFTGKSLNLLRPGFVVLGDKARRWSSDQRVTETLEIDQDPMIKAIVEQVFAWARADFPWLEKRYRITVMEETPHALEAYSPFFPGKEIPRLYHHCLFRRLDPCPFGGTA